MSIFLIKKKSENHIATLGLFMSAFCELELTLKGIVRSSESGSLSQSSFLDCKNLLLPVNSVAFVLFVMIVLSIFQDCAIRC